MMTRSALALALLFSCQPVSHVLLEPMTDGGRDASPPAPVWSDCGDALSTGRTGDACAFSVGCSGGLTGPSTGARCLDGALLVATVTRIGPVESGCTAPIDSNGGPFEPSERTAPGCFAARTCERPGSDASFEFCQRGARASARADSPSPLTDCPSLLFGARDGDRCAGELFCVTSNRDGHGLLAWCDDGLVRLAPDYPLYVLM